MSLSGGIGIGLLLRGGAVFGRNRPSREDEVFGEIPWEEEGPAEEP